MSRMDGQNPGGISQSTADGLYIRKDGTSVTTAQIPFAQGIYMALNSYLNSGNYLNFYNPIVSSFYTRIGFDATDLIIETTNPTGAKTKSPDIRIRTANSSNTPAGSNDGGKIHLTGSNGSGSSFVNGLVSIDNGTSPTYIATSSSNIASLYIEGDLEVAGTNVFYNNFADGFMRITSSQMTTFDLFGSNNTWTGTNKINVNSTTAFFVEQDGVKDNVFIVDTTNGVIGIGNAGSSTILMNAQNSGLAFVLDMTRTLSSRVTGVTTLKVFDTLSWTGSVTTHNLSSYFITDTRNINASGTNSTNVINMNLTHSSTSIATTENVRALLMTVSDTTTYNRSAGGTTANINAFALTASMGPTYNDGAGTPRTLTYNAALGNLGIGAGFVLTSGTINYRVDGFNIGISSNGITITAGTGNVMICGYYLGGSNPTGGTNNYMYGFLFEATSTNQFAFVNNTAANNYLGRDNSKSYFGTNTNAGTLAPATVLATGDASIYYDGTDFIINPKEIGTGTLKVLGDITLSTFNLITDTSTGTKIATGTTQKLGFWNATPVAQNTGWGSITNVTTDRAYDANSTTLDEIADVLGTLIAQLVTYGMLGA